jgi:hypothetical protein
VRIWRAPVKGKKVKRWKAARNLSKTHKQIANWEPCTPMKTKFLQLTILLVASIAASFAQPFITEQPTNQTASLFADVSFRVMATGDGPLSYQWRFNDADLIERDFLSPFGTNRALDFKLSEYYARFNADFVEQMNKYSQTRPDVRILYVNNGSHSENVLSNLDAYGFTVATIDAIHDPTLTDKSFTWPGADYVFWIGGHPTIKIHKLIASWNFEVLTNSILEKLEATIVGGNPNIQMSHLQIGRDYTLEKSADLRAWSDIQSFTSAAGTNQWTATAGATGPSYYRLKWER